MGWWQFGSKKQSGENQNNATQQEQQQGLSSGANSGDQGHDTVFLDDLPPKFNVEEKDPMKRLEKQRQQQRSIFKSAFDSVSLNDFAFANLVRIPCFRDAGLIGLSSMGVLGTTLFLVHKNPSKAANWAVGAGLLGSLVGWEQCRTQRKRSFENVERAKAAMKAKPRPMIKKPSGENEDK